MGIFKKTIKYSKPSEDLDNKIKNLDEELKQTGVIGEQDVPEVLCIQESSVEELPKIYDKVEVQEEETLYNWRESLLVEETTDEPVVIDESYHKTVGRVESYISESNKELIQIRDQVFQEISESTLLNLPEIKCKIEKVLEIYDQIQEGLLNEPPETQNEDPLTPLNQNFVTTEDLNKHYTLFINRIQEQLATVGGGGETKLKYLDDIVGISTNASAYDGKFLKYDHSIGKFVFATAGGGAGSQTLNQTLGLGNTSSLGMSVGVVTATSINFASGGVLGDLYSDGGIGIGLKASPANYYAIVASNNLQQYLQVDDNQIFITTGYASTTTGTYDWKFDKNGALTFPDTTIQSTAFTGYATYASTAGIATYASTAGVSTYATRAGIATYASTSGIATTAGYASTAGIATVAQGLTGTPNINVGIVTATSYNGSGATLTGIITSLVAGTNVTITQSSGIATISATGGGGGSQTLDQTLALGNSSTLGMSVGVITATTLNVTGIATIGTGIVTTLRGTNINYTGLSTFTSTFVTNVNVTGIATIGTGIVTTLRGTTLNYTGVSTFSSGPVLISSTGTATTTGTSSQPLQVTGGAYVSGSVGVGTTNPTAALHVFGNSIYTGIITAQSFSGTATTAITAGYATTAGISTVAQGLTGTPNISVGIVTATDYRIQSVAEKTTLVNGNTVSLVYNTGGGNVAICTNPSGDITLNVTGIPTDSAFDNYSLSFTVITTNAGTARSCTAVNLNGVSRTIKWFGGSLSSAISGVTTSSGYDSYNFTGINTVGSASTTANYIVLGSVNGSYR